MNVCGCSLPGMCPVRWMCPLFHVCECICTWMCVFVCTHVCMWMYMNVSECWRIRTRAAFPYIRYHCVRNLNWTSLIARIKCDRMWLEKNVFDELDSDTFACIHVHAECMWIHPVRKPTDSGKKPHKPRRESSGTPGKRPRSDILTWGHQSTLWPQVNLLAPIRNGAEMA